MDIKCVNYVRYIQKCVTLLSKKHDNFVQKLRIQITDYIFNTK